MINQFTRCAERVRHSFQKLALLFSPTPSVSKVHEIIPSAPLHVSVRCNPQKGVLPAGCYPQGVRMRECHATRPATAGLSGCLFFEKVFRARSTYRSTDSYYRRI